MTPNHFLTGGGLGYTGITTCCQTAVIPECTTTFTPITASAAFAALTPGWNLGNSLDTFPDGDSWNNPPVTSATFDDVLARGFRSVRIPVTWSGHISVDSSPWAINSTWLDRVETIVDEVLDRGFYAIINVHHDSRLWADLTTTGANYTLIGEKFKSIWTQIGARFGCKSSKLLFESINEPAGSTETEAAELNALNDIFLDAINIAGGFNSQRVVSLCGLGNTPALTSQFFSRGNKYPNQPWGLQFHYYSPYPFIFGAWGSTIWGSDSDKAALELDFSMFRDNFTDIPIFIGEWDATPAGTEAAARWKYFDFFVRTAAKYDFSHSIFDNGADLLNRSAHTWYDPTAMDILINAAAGTVNSLADSTTDPSATSQSSSAYLFHAVGTAVVDQSVSYILNGNSLTSIKNSAGITLTTTQYTLSSSGTLTLKAAFLSTLYSASSVAGIKDTLTLTFSQGAQLTLQIVQYGVPTVGATSYTAQSTDQKIPISYAGLSQVAAVRAVLTDGTYLTDSWTVYSGPLQQGRWLQGDFGWDSSNFIIYAAGGQQIIAAGKSVNLMLEFYPRSVGANVVNITVHP
ncbi:glycoside hydrolase superfamily [Tricladium varicosporioides]|nr:glycoside hydrolase superfamily [Hymenoscyphus varicosporioides]